MVKKTKKKTGKCFQLEIHEPRGIKLCENKREINYPGTRIVFLCFISFLHLSLSYSNEQQFPSKVSYKTTISMLTICLELHSIKISVNIHIHAEIILYVHICMYDWLSVKDTLIRHKIYVNVVVWDGVYI